MTKIYVGNLPFSATDAEVRELFAQHGTVESVSIITDRDTGRPRGFGFVEMSRADASRAIQNINGKELGGAADGRRLRSRHWRRISSAGRVFGGSSTALGLSGVVRLPQRTRCAQKLKPPPNPGIRSSVPGRTRRSSSASQSATGTVAADMLP